MPQIGERLSYSSAFRQVTKYCEHCGQILTLHNMRDIKRKRFCSRSCRTLSVDPAKSLRGRPLSGEHKEKMRQTCLEKIAKGYIPVGWRKYPSFKRINVRGYYFVGHERKHRILMENKLGWELPSDQVVHHIDGNILNNSLDNLCVMSRSEHSKLHTDERRKLCRLS